MPHRDWRVLISMCCLVVAQFCSADGNKIKIAGTQNQSPLIHYVEDVLELAYQRIDYEVEFVTVPLGRSFVEADQGRVDGLKARVSSVAKKYPHLRAVPFPLFQFEITLIGRRQHCGICDIRQMDSVATVRGFQALENYLQQTGLSVNVIRVTSAAQAFEMLKKGRVDGVILPSNSVAGEYRRDPVTWSRYSLHSESDFHFLHQGYGHLIPLLLEQLEQLEKSGRLAELKRKYAVNEPAKIPEKNSLASLRIVSFDRLEETLPKDSLRFLNHLFSSLSADSHWIKHSRVNEEEVGQKKVHTIYLGQSYDSQLGRLWSDMHVGVGADGQPLFVSFENNQAGRDIKYLFEREFRAYRFREIKRGF